MKLKMKKMNYSTMPSTLPNALSGSWAGSSLPGPVPWDVTLLWVQIPKLDSLNLCFLILKWGEAHFVGKVCLVRALIFVNPLAVRLWRLPLRQWCWGSVAPFMRALGGDGPGLYLLHPGCLLCSACRWRECWIKDVMNFSRFFLEELLKNFPIAQVVNRLLPLAKVLHDSFSSYLIGYTF